MNHEQVREIAEAAFRAHFSDINIVSINVKPGFDHYDDPVVDVKIIYDGDVEQLIAPDKVPDMMKVRTEIFSKVWWDAQDSPATRAFTSSPSPTSASATRRRCSGAVAAAKSGPA